MYMFQLLSLNLRLSYSKKLLVRTSRFLISLSLGLVNFSFFHNFL